MKKLAILLVFVVLAAGCLGDSPEVVGKKTAIEDQNQNAPPPLPDDTTVPTTADNGVPSLPNADSAAPDSPSDNPPPVPAILGLMNY